MLQHAKCVINYRACKCFCRNKGGFPLTIHPLSPVVAFRSVTHIGKKDGR